MLIVQQLVMSNGYFILNAIKNVKAAEENISREVHTFDVSDSDSNVNIYTFIIELSMKDVRCTVTAKMSDLGDHSLSLI